MSSRRAQHSAILETGAAAPDFLLKIVLIGESGVGKTNLLSRFISDDFKTDSKTTVGVGVATTTMNFEEKQVQAQIWDTTGHKRYRKLTSAYFRGAAGALIVYDITAPASFLAVGRWLRRLREADPKVVVMLIGNKSDLRDSQIVSFEDGSRLAEREKLIFVEMSAKDSSNVKEGFTKLIAEILANYTKTGFDDPAKDESARPEKRSARYPFEDVVGGGGCCCWTAH
jgi:small GTP-binding protein